MARAPWLVAFMMTAPIALAGCLDSGASSDGDSGDDGGGDDTVETATLSGTTKDAASIESGSLDLTTAATSYSDAQPLTDVQVIAVAQDGSTKTAKVDAAGDFDLDLAVGKDYGLVVLDLQTFEVLGYLADPGNPDSLKKINFDSEVDLANLGVDSEEKTVDPGDDGDTDKVEPDDGDFEKSAEGGLEAKNAEQSEDGGDDGGDDGGSEARTFSFIDYLGRDNRWLVSTNSDGYSTLTFAQTGLVDTADNSGNGVIVNYFDIGGVGNYAGYDGDSEDSYDAQELAVPNETEAPNQVLGAGQEKYVASDTTVYIAGGNTTFELPLNWELGKSNDFDAADGDTITLTPKEIHSLTVEESSIEVLEMKVKNQDIEEGSRDVFFLKYYGAVVGADELSASNFDADADTSAQDILADQVRFGRVDGDGSVTENAFSKALHEGDDDHGPLPGILNANVDGEPKAVRDAWVKYMHKYKSELRKAVSDGIENPGIYLNRDHDKGPVEPAPDTSDGPVALQMGTEYDFTIYVDGDSCIESCADGKGGTKDITLDKGAFYFQIDGERIGGASEKVSEDNPTLPSDKGDKKDKNFPTTQTLAVPSQSKFSDLATRAEVPFTADSDSSTTQKASDAKVGEVRLMMSYTYTDDENEQHTVRRTVAEYLAVDTP